MTVAYSDTNVPHLALPLVLGPTGSFNTIQQDTVEEVAQSVEVLLGTAKGDRVITPDYGIADPTFANPDPNEITQTITVWEPRADPKVTVGSSSTGTSKVSVKVALANAS